MPNQFTTTTFAVTYKDDWTESDGYHRILFNSRRAVQARELTQMQTIIQKEVERFGRNIFKEGASVNPGGLTVNNEYEFIKISSASSVPSDLSLLIGTTYTGQSSGVKAVVLEAVATEGADPVTLYVRYTDTSSGTAGTTPIRMTAGEDIDNGTYPLTVQTTNTLANPAVGQGTKVSVARGDFFTQGHFVFAQQQSKIISKYSNTPTVDIGFRVVQDIVTISDTNDLYDNQGDQPNTSAPGADRYRIRLTVTTRDEIDSDESFVYVARVQNGQIVDVVQGNEDYNRINDLLAIRTKEESGNYNVRPFTIKFEENDSDTTILDLNISDGLSYVNGYRAEKNFPTTITVNRAQDTVTENNEVVAANYGNYVVGTSGSGVRNINTFEQVNLNDATGYGGSVIGTARVRAVEEDGANFRYYLFGISMNAGESFRSTRSIGTSVNDYADLVLENSQAVIKEAANNNLLFPLPTGRPQSISDISLTVQRRFTTTTDGAGAATLTLTASGETFANTNEWFLANADSDYYDAATISGAGTASASIAGGPVSSSNLEVLAYVNKSEATSRTKTLTANTVTNTLDSDGNGLQYLDLTVADIYDLQEVRLEDSTGTSIINRFSLDNGQRDNFYALGRLVLNTGQTAPTGNVYAAFRYFQHGTSGDFFSVNSYTGQVNYEDIPTHRTATGDLVPLRDVLDFRPVQNASGTYSGGNARVNELPENTDLITTDVIYYQPRYGKVIIDTEGILRFIAGPSSLTPIFPSTPENALELYRVRLNAFTLNDSDMTVEKVESKRFTMSDIAKLEERVEALEEVTSLSLLELDTSSFDVLDSNGNNRTKSGFLVDNFKDHAFSNVNGPEYRASIDPDTRILRPAFSANNIRLIYDSDASTNTIMKGDNVYLKHSDAILINQNLATGTININPFSVITNRGTIELSPASDNWAEQERIPARVIDGASNVTQALSRNFNNWGWNWNGRIVRFSRRLNENVIGSSARGVTRRNAPGNRIDVTTTVRRVVGQRVVDVAFIPFMRSAEISFKAEGLKPNTRMFPYFDNTDVSDWCRQEGFVRFNERSAEIGNVNENATAHPDGATNLVTDAEGKLEGSFFIPNNDTLRFRSGTRVFKLLDISTPIDANSTSIAEETFVSQGIIETVQADIVTTRTTRRIARRSGRGGGGGTNSREVFGGSTNIDPLAQSFLINSVVGNYLTKVGVYFSTKDDTVPVQLQIRPLVNGIPSSIDIVPGSVKFLSPSDVSTSADASAETVFEFDEPIFLAPGTRYAVVLLAESIDYNVYIAEAGEFVLGSTERRVSRQPTLGSLFLSQNSATWTPDQTKDLMFKLYRADFTDTTGTVILNNARVPNRLLSNDPFQVDSASATVTVNHPNHGFTVGDDVNISGMDSTEDVGGISFTSINGSRAITAIDGTGYQFTADSTSTSEGIGGGSTILASQNIPFDIFVPTIQTLVPNNTAVGYAAKLTTGKSFAGSETAYQKASSFTDVFPDENNFRLAPAVVADSDIEITNLPSGEKSATFRVLMTTTNNEVTPMVDLQRCGVILVDNSIDKQDSAATSGFNVPLTFVNETDPSQGSHLSKHVTRPVVLEEDAVGLKVLIGANRPSASDFLVYYRTSDGSTDLGDTSWTLASIDTPVPSDENPDVYREYEYLIGNQGGGLTPFTEFQIKVVFRTTNSSRVPTIRDLRVIALGV